jgi:hypothetical protein
MSEQREFSSKFINAPWKVEQTAALNAYQKSRRFHPYTCGFNRTDKNHMDGEGILVATANGWICPFCDYKQDWAAELLLRVGKGEI